MSEIERILLISILRRCSDTTVAILTDEVGRVGGGLFLFCSKDNLVSFVRDRTRISHLIALCGEVLLEVEVRRSHFFADIILVILLKGSPPSRVDPYLVALCPQERYVSRLGRGLSDIFSCGARGWSFVREAGHTLVILRLFTAHLFDRLGRT